ncbi:unnamed protein product, partial [Ilex paraguariensis]
MEIPTKSNNLLIYQMSDTNLTKALENIVSNYEFLLARSSQYDSNNRIESSLFIWLLPKNFACKAIKIFGVIHTQ